MLARCDAQRENTRQIRCPSSFVRPPRAASSRKKAKPLSWPPSRDVWACAVPEVGVLNILRGEYSSYGKTQNDEYGTTENINDFFSMLESDALLHIQKATKYPAMLVITGWEDPRVSSWQCGKFAAAAQNATSSDKPVLLKVNFNGGHGGNALDKQTAMKEIASKYSFILWQCGFDMANKYD